VDKPLVLVVEDHEDLRELYQQCLHEAGFDVITARNGAEGVALAASRRPSAIVMDLQMPDVHGWEAIRRIRQASPEAEARPYIIAVTAHIADGARIDAYEAGADDFVAKPHDPNVICAIVTSALNARRG
jgi:DNA-binding response OmpR family regulator